MQHTSDNLVSIITPAYNCEKYIEKTIDSVRGQTYPYWEHMIVDDCSTDQTLRLLRKYEKIDDRINIISLNQNIGPTRARNLAIKKANGRFIAFLDSDDIWLNNKLETQVNFIIKNRAVLTYCNYEIIDSETEKTIGIIKSPSELTHKEFKMSNEIGCLTAVYDSAVLGKIYMPDTRNREDWALWWEITRRGYSAKNIGDVLAKYRFRPRSRSNNRFNTVLYTWRFYREIAKLPLHERLFRICVHSFIKLRKHKMASTYVKDV